MTRTIAFVLAGGQGSRLLPLTGHEADAIKTKRPRVVILNDAAWTIVQSQRGQHPV